MSATDIKLNSGKSWLQFFIVFLTGVTIAFGMFKVPVNMPNIMNFYGVEMSQVGLLMSVVGLTCIFTAIPAGAIMQKIGAKKFGLIVIAAAIIENVIGAFAPTFEVLLATRFLEGISYGCMTMVSVAIITANFSVDKRGLPNGIWVIWVSLANLLVAQLANVLVPSFGWQGEWIAAAVMQAVMLVLFILFVKDPAIEEPEPVAGGKKPSVLEGLKEPAVALMSLALGLLAVGCGCYTGLYPTFLQTGLGFDPTTANNIISISTFGGMVGSLLVGWVINKTAIRNRGILLVVIAVISAAAFALQFRIPSSFVIVTVFAVVLSAVTQFNMPVGFAMAPDAMKRPEFLAMGLGLVMIGANVGGALSTFLPAKLVEDAGGVWTACDFLVVGFAVLAALCALGATLYQRKYVLKNKDESSAA